MHNKIIYNQINDQTVAKKLDAMDLIKQEYKHKSM